MEQKGKIKGNQLERGEGQERCSPNPSCTSGREGRFASSVAEDVDAVVVASDEAVAKPLPSRQIEARNGKESRCKDETEIHFPRICELERLLFEKISFSLPYQGCFLVSFGFNERRQPCIRHAFL